MHSCHYCGTTEKDLRPYGPNHSMVCFDCAFATPERGQEAEKNFSLQLNSIEGPVVIGLEAGPVPLSAIIKNVDSQKEV